MRRDMISSSQVTAIVASATIGVAILGLPARTARIAGPDAWLSIVVGAFATAGVAWAIVSLARRFPGQTFVSYARDLLGPAIGTTLVVLFALAELSAGALVIRTFGEAVVSVVLTETPLETLVVIMVLLTAYLALQRVIVFARVMEFHFHMMVLTLSLFAATVLGRVSMPNLYPVLGKGLKPVLIGTWDSLPAWVGFETMLYHLGYAVSPREATRATLLGVVAVGMAYLVITVETVAIFGAGHMKVLQWPVLEAMKFAHVPGMIFERLESVFLVVWMAAAFTTAGALVYTSIRSLGDALNLSDHSPLVPASVPILYGLAMLSPNPIVTTAVTSVVAKVVGLYTVFLLAVLYVAAGIAAARRRGRDDGA